MFLLIGYLRRTLSIEISIRAHLMRMVNSIHTYIHTYRYIYRYIYIYIYNQGSGPTVWDGDHTINQEVGGVRIDMFLKGQGEDGE